ncbi:MAG: hypothetical protein OHK0021_17940 [Bryobacter sp.]
MEFPQLDTEVTVQLHSAKQRKVRSRTFRFLGDAVQGQQLRTGSGFRWLLRYESLNPEEASRLRQFFEMTLPGQSFSFTDPWTGTVHANCRLGNAGLNLLHYAPGSYEVEFEVEDAQ